jgi:hypothetical protein
MIIIINIYHGELALNVPKTTTEQLQHYIPYKHASSGFQVHNLDNRDDGDNNNNNNNTTI